ncbi:MAG: transketolase family protein [Lachnospiraceae bacterium]|jgi:transketolase|nr:transketolase family protein [Lachnospiraceae bacterium]
MKVVYNGEKDRAFKEVLGETIPRLAEEDKDVIYLDADLMGCIGTAKWAAANPDRAINCGIAEANMMGIAAGMSAVGYKPIVHTFGPFASRRCFDQIFLSGAYAGNSVTVIGTDPGVCAAFNGGTHMPFEDMALYRAIPGAYVFDITDAAMLESVLEQCKDIEGIKYIRVGRKNNMKMYEDGFKAEIGKGIVVKEIGTDAVVFACGIMTAMAMEAAEILKKEGIQITVVDMFTVKPLDEELVEKYAKATGAVVTAENHNKIGGLYSAVTEVLSKKCPTPVEYVAVEDVFGEVGPQDYLEERFGLTAEHIVKKVKAAIDRK